MSFNPFDLFKTIDKGIDLASEAIEDPDKRNELNAAYSALKEATYLKELDTKTVPWVDALHKMQRGILSVLSMGVSIYMVHSGITDPIALAASMTPAAGYNIVKGKGK